MKKLLLPLCIISFMFNLIIYLHKQTPTLPPIDKPKPEEPKPLPPPEEKKEIVPDFINVPLVSQRVSENSKYADIMNHSRNPEFGHDRMTNAHETTHMINSDIRNSAGSGNNGFYVIDGKGVVVKEPNIRKRDMIKYLPPELRSYRYGTYVTGQNEWDDQPLYIFDEWTAYINGGAVSVEDQQNGNHQSDWTDAVSGCLDFSIYSIALAMAIKEKDPEYFESNKQFRNFLYWNLKRARDTYDVGSKMKEFTFADQDKLLNNLVSSPAAEGMRKFINENLEGLWLEHKEPVQTTYTDWHRGKHIRLNFIPPFSKENE